MKRVFIKIFSSFFGIIASFLLVILFVFLLKFGISYYGDLGNILYVIKNKWNLNPTSGIGFASLLLGFILILFSVISLILIYTYDFVFKSFKSKFASESKPTQSLKNFNKKSLDKKRKIEQNINLYSVKKEPEAFKKNQSNFNLEHKKDKPKSDDISEIPLPKSITNSDAYSVVQRMKNNNENPLVNNKELDENKQVEPEFKEEKPQNLDTKNDELRRRILKKFNTSLNDKKDV